MSTFPVYFLQHIVSAIQCIEKGCDSMKLEKISDTRIRCTLNKDDLNDRELRISELAYGSEKAKALFRDMMQQAAYELGFEADDIPLMIEAIPISSDCLILDITKVEDPDELDTRFSNFTPVEDHEDVLENDTQETYADEIINCFEHIAKLMNKNENTEKDSETAKKSKTKKESKNKQPEKNSNTPLVRVFSFNSFQEVCLFSKVLVSFYHGVNTLYKGGNYKYYLSLDISNHSPEEFNKVCNLASEYGHTERTSSANLLYMQEHYEVIVSKKAIQILAKY